MMNLDGLPVPGGLRTYAQSADREKDVLQQSIYVDPAWWSKRVPGAALTADTAHPTPRDATSSAWPSQRVRRLTVPATSCGHHSRGAPARRSATTHAASPP